MISCIVPVFNGQRYLGEAIESILSQTYSPIEIIVVDDGSTDNSVAVAREYEDRIRLFTQSNAGPAAARNKGIRHAEGEFLAFLDADDLWHPEKLTRQIAQFNDRPQLAYCVTHIQNFWVAELAEEQSHLQSSRLAEAVPGYTAPTLLVRTKSALSIGEFCESMPHTSEIDWFVRADAAGFLGAILPEVLVRRRLHDKNRSRLRSERSTEEYLRFIKARLDRMRHNSSSPPQNGQSQ